MGRLQRRRGPDRSPILGIHHVRDDLGAPLGWDLAFLALGAVLLVAGAAMVRGTAQR